MTEKVVRTGLFAVALTAVCVCCMPFIAQAQQADDVAGTPATVNHGQSSSAESIEALPTESSNEDDAVEGTVSGDESEYGTNQDQSAIDPDVNTDADDTEAAEGDKAIEDEAVIGDVETDSTSEAVVDAAATPEAAPVADAGSVSVQSAESVVPQAAPGYWVVSDLNNGYGLQRYWYEASGVCATNRLIDPAEGSGWWAYATPLGYVVRGAYDTGNGMVYLADNDGRLAAANGMVVTGDYTGGVLQRYYIDPVTHAARSGFFTVDGYGDCFGLGGAGYVLRGTMTWNDYVLLANNDGQMEATDGWLVTGAYTGGALQRYWMDTCWGTSYKGAKVGYSPDGWEHYTMPAGYVVRGAYDTGSGMVYLADNDGRLAAANGWLVTGAYTGGALQRYYIDPVTHAARSGFFTVAGYGDCFGLGGAGYVLRGKSGWGNYVLLANNDGQMETTDGWLVTGAYDGGVLHRYWFEECWANHYKGARVLYFTVGGAGYYGVPNQGYVIHGDYAVFDGNVNWANNDGVLSYICRTCCDDYTINVAVARIVAGGVNSLESAFWYVSDFPYISMSLFPGGDWAPGFAMEMINNGGGNCYRFAALMCVLARALGENAGVVSGWVPSMAGGQAPHGWTEIYRNDGTYIIDCDLQHEIPGYNWFMCTYGSAPTSYGVW